MSRTAARKREIVLELMEGDDGTKPPPCQLLAATSLQKRDHEKTERSARFPCPHSQIAAPPPASRELRPPGSRPLRCGDFSHVHVDLPIGSPADVRDLEGPVFIPAE